MMMVFFIGIGAASIGTGFADSGFELAVGLTCIGLFAAIYFVRRRIVVVEWPDILLLLLPALVWFELVLMYPIGKPLVSFWELTILGVLAGFSIILRRRFTGQSRVEASKAGVLGTTSLAVLFWAFMPSW